MQDLVLVCVLQELGSAVVCITNGFVMIEQRERKWRSTAKKKSRIRTKRDRKKKGRGNRGGDHKELMYGPSLLEVLVRCYW